MYPLVVVWINCVKNHKEICGFFQNVLCGSMASFLLNVITMYPLASLWSNWWGLSKRTQHISPGYGVDILFKIHNEITMYSLVKSWFAPSVIQWVHVDYIGVTDIKWSTVPTNPRVVSELKYSAGGNWGWWEDHGSLWWNLQGWEQENLNDRGLDLQFVLFLLGQSVTNMISYWKDQRNMYRNWWHKDERHVKGEHNKTTSSSVKLNRIYKYKAGSKDIHD
jgi:hypothetical protein